MNSITKKIDVAFSLPAISADKINSAAVARVNEMLPELDAKTRAFDRNNSQHTLSLMTLTMLNGQSPMRMMRQVMAEVEKRKMALAEAQVSHAKLVQEIEEISAKDDPVSVAETRQKGVSLDMMESKINGSFKDIATLIDAYENIKDTNGIGDWSEEDFGFELMYRNLLEGGRAQTATIEYCQQYGIHPQVCLTEVSGYVQHTGEVIVKGKLPHANDLEDFLNLMADKYVANVNETSKRLFGKSEFTNKDYMIKLECNK